ncbi:mite allergen Der p 3-like [Anabrus simplex]|uniref:mite allergen Der p 3-like n=1 Tax=Anabrus simplex TaxID=316456 RepID=UPI0035A29EFD
MQDEAGDGTSHQWNSSMLYYTSSVLARITSQLHGTLPAMLMKKEVVVISPIFCWVSYSWAFIFVTDQEICTFIRPGDIPSGTFEGDSGSPVLANDEVVGIASWVHERFYLPDVHTRVSSYIDWIEEHVGPLSSTK